MSVVATRSIEAWNALRLTPGLGPRRLMAVARALSREDRSAAALIGMPAAELAPLGLGRLLAERAASLLATPAPVPEGPSWTRLMCPDDEEFPRDRMSGPLPLPVLMWVAGDVSILGRPAVAIAGSRSAHPHALELAREIAGRLAQSGYNVVSGYASGVDRTAHQVALAVGGATTAVLAEGFLRLRPLAEMAGIGAEGLLFVTGFDPDAAWTAHRAMERNAHIAALSDAVVIVASDVKGGSWAQGQLCLRARKRLIVVDLPEDVAPGNRKLIEEGAVALLPGEANAILDRLISIKEPGPVQMEMLG